MFDLVTGHAEHIPSRPALPMLLSVGAQVVVVSTALAVSALWVTDSLPNVSTMMAFVAPPPSPPPPPPPPPPPAGAVKRAEPVKREEPKPDAIPVPIEEPPQIAKGVGEGVGRDDGVPGGVEGGVPGGVVGGVIGGVLGGVLDAPPPPPPVAAGPVRIGGKISQPALVYRVEPEYPRVAVAAQLQGVSILEAVVDEEGKVTDVRVLRSASGLLDREAMAAVRQWRYSPLVLNGIKVRFILTVTLSFRLESPTS